MSFRKQILNLLGLRKGLNPNYRNVLICIDKFKDTLSAPDAASTIQSVLREKYDDDVSVQEVLVSDGGEGFLDCIEISKSTGKDAVERVAIEVAGTMPGQVMKGSFLLNRPSNTAYIEVAHLNGLQSVPIDKRDPFVNSSIGIGQAMRKCFDDYDVKRFIIGSGGSAYSDGGFGAVRAMNVFDFYTQNGDKLA